MKDTEKRNFGIKEGGRKDTGEGKLEIKKEKKYRKGKLKDK
jgi:hypothetical protein